MPNPFEFIHELREMNVDLCKRLDTIIEKMEELIRLQNQHDTIEVWYGDGK